MQRYPVAVTVFVTAEGVDRGDAHNVGTQAVRETLAAAGHVLTTHTYNGHRRSATVVDVTETGAAVRAGALTVQPREITPE